MHGCTAFCNCDNSSHGTESLARTVLGAAHPGFLQTPATLRTSNILPLGPRYALAGVLSLSACSKALLQDRHERVLAATCAAAGALLELLAPPAGAKSARAPAPAAAAPAGSPLESAGAGAGASGAEAGGAERSGVGASGTSPGGEAAKGGPEGAVLEGIGAMLCQPAFYKGVVQSKAPLVRRAGYSLVALAARRCPSLLQASCAVWVCSTGARL